MFPRPIAMLLILVVSAPAARGQGHGPTPVVTSPVVEREIPRSIRLVGTVLADRSAVVASEVGGLVLDLPAMEGQFLKQGELICQIDPTLAQLRLDEARARRGAALAALEELENGSRPETIDRLEASVAEAQAMAEKWRFEKQRIADLYEAKQSSAKEMHDAEMEAIAAERRFAATSAELREARNGARAEVIARARQEAAMEDAAVARLARELEKTSIKAPFAGAIVQKRTEVGEWIQPGGPVAEMVAIDTVKVRVDVPEVAVRFAASGAPATVDVEALGETYSGPVSRVIPRATAAARTFPVEIDLSNPKHAILPGMFVWANIPAGDTVKRLMVSKDAIVSQGPSKQLFVIRPGAQDATMAVPIAIRTGLEIAGEIEVEGAGLVAGDLVVVRANERLFGPSPVQPTPQAASTPAGAEAVQARQD